MSGELRIIPGYQRLSAKQRETLLKLHEHGRFQSPVRIISTLPARTVKLTDRQGRMFTI